MNGLGYSIPVNAWEPYLNLVMKKRWDPPAAKAEEVFIIVRELSKDGGFRWKTWYDACVAVMDPSKHQLQSGFKCTVGNMLRAQVKHGTIIRMKRGRYSFSIPSWMASRSDLKDVVPTVYGQKMIPLMPKRPLYVSPGCFNMTPERNLQLELEEKMS